MIRISSADLEALMGTLEVDVVALTECVVSPGHRLRMGEAGVPGLHYNLKGTGRIVIGGGPPIALEPHTLVIVPPHSPFHIETQRPTRAAAPLTEVDGRLQKAPPGTVRRVVAGDAEPDILLICGFFNATVGASLDLFAALHAPIVEQFDAADRLEGTLRLALAELIDQEIGSGAMSAALLKQVVIMILRRSQTSQALWAERFAMLSDPQIARAFAAMAIDPGANHTVSALADRAHLSRSVFMARFAALVGDSPMAVLRGLRMRQAARQLAADHLTIEQIAHAAGYDSRSSFVRAFRKAFGCDPSDYRVSAGRPSP